MADMFGQLPEMQSGPMSGFLRGVQGNYAMQQQEQDLKTKALVDQMNELKLQQETKGVPLQDATRANQLSEQGMISNDYASGAMQKDRDAAREAALTEHLRKKSDSELAILDNQYKAWDDAAKEMSGAESLGPYAAQQKWDGIKEHMKRLGVDTKGMPDIWGAESQKMLESRAAPAINNRKVVDQLRVDKQKEDAADARNKYTADKNLEGHKATVGGNQDFKLATMKADERIDYEINQSIQKNGYITPALLDRASQLELQKERALPKYDKLQQSEEKRFNVASEAGKKALNKEVGLPENNSSFARYGQAQVDNAMDTAVNRSLKTRYGSEPIAVGDKKISVNEYIDQKAGSRVKAPTDSVVSKDKGLTPEQSAKLDMWSKNPANKAFTRAELIEKARAAGKLPPVVPSIPPQSLNDIPQVSPQLRAMGGPITNG